MASLEFTLDFRRRSWTALNRLDAMLQKATGLSGKVSMVEAR